MRGPERLTRFLRAAWLGQGCLRRLSVEWRGMLRSSVLVLTLSTACPLQYRHWSIGLLKSDNIGEMYGIDEQKSCHMKCELLMYLTIVVVHR
jgi:hypothetical protein